MIPGVRLLPASERRWTRWRNDGGATAQVAARPADASVDSFDWRVSIAEIEESGAFSTFAGVDRVLTALHGVGPVADPGLVLVVDGVEHQVPPNEPFAFSGDSTTNCRVSRPPMRDLNVMTRRGSWHAVVRIHTLDRGPVIVGVPITAGSTTVVVVLTGQVELAGPHASALLGEHDALVTVDEEGVELLPADGSGAPPPRVALIRLDPVAGSSAVS